MDFVQHLDLARDGNHESKPLLPSNQYWCCAQHWMIQYINLLALISLLLISTSIMPVVYLPLPTQIDFGSHIYTWQAMRLLSSSKNPRGDGVEMFPALLFSHEGGDSSNLEQVGSALVSRSQTQLLKFSITGSGSMRLVQHYHRPIASFNASQACTIWTDNHKQCTHVKPAVQLSSLQTSC